MASGGTLYPLTVSFDESPVPMLALLVNGIRIQGSAGAPRAELRKMLQFVVDHKLEPIIMKWPMTAEGITTALETLREGRMRYRGVLVAE